jgi:hypothetical protein
MEISKVLTERQERLIRLMHASNCRAVGLQIVSSNIKHDA